MATVQAERAISVPASADLSADQYKFMVLTSGKLVLAGDGADSIGVLSDKPAAADRPGRLVIGGVTKVTAGATVAVDANVMSNASGLGITAAGTGKFVICKALEAAVVNQVFSVLLVSNYALT